MSSENNEVNPEIAVSGTEIPEDCPGEVSPCTEAEGEQKETEVPAEPLGEAAAEEPAAEVPEESGTEEAKDEPEDQVLQLSRGFNEALAGVQAAIDEIGFETRRVSAEMKKTNDLFQNWVNGRVLKMQKEIDEYHAIESKKVFNDILTDITRVYCDNEKILEDIEDEKLRKRVGYIFDDIEQLLDAYDVQRQKSQPGDKRINRMCKIRNVIETNDPDKHDTVARSLKSGFYQSNHVLTKETIDVYIYKAEQTEEPAEAGDPGTADETY